MVLLMTVLNLNTEFVTVLLTLLTPCDDLKAQSSLRMSLTTSESTDSHVSCSLTNFECLGSFHQLSLRPLWFLTS